MWSWRCSTADLASATSSQPADPRDLWGARGPVACVRAVSVAGIPERPSPGLEALAAGGSLRFASRELLSAGAAVTGLSAAGLPRDRLQPVAVALPPSVVARRQVVVAVEQAGGSVDELANDVGVPGVPVRLGDRVHQEVLQRDPTVLRRPPRHVADGVEGQRINGGVRVL